LILEPKIRNHPPEVAFSPSPENKHHLKFKSRVSKLAVFIITATGTTKPAENTWGVKIGSPQKWMVQKSFNFETTNNKHGIDTSNK